MTRFLLTLFVSCALLTLHTSFRREGSHQATANSRLSRMCRNARGVKVNEFTYPAKATGVNVVSQFPVHVVMHAAVDVESQNDKVVNRFREVIVDLLTASEQAGVYNIASSFTLNVVGSGFEQVRLLVHDELGDRFSKVEIVNLDRNVSNFEFSSVNFLLRSAKDLESRSIEAHFLYIHTKGLHHHGDYTSKWHWRKYMEFWTLRRHQDARGLLALGYDALGSNAIDFSAGAEIDSRIRVNPSHGWHYSGNFWWATTSHLSRLPQLPENTTVDHWTRCLAEFLILSPLPHMCAGELHHSESAHMYGLGLVPSFWELENTRTGATLIKF